MKFHPTGIFDNTTKQYQHITAVPLAAAMGAEICDVQVGRLTDKQFVEIESALYRHKMIFLRDQDMSRDDQEAFTLRFGEFGIDAYTTGAGGHRNVQPLVKEKDTRTEMVFGSRWHTDSPFMEKAPAISMLFAADVPPFGGDTMWCNTALAYATLSNAMQRLLAPLRVHMSGVDVVNQLRKETSGDEPSALGNTELDLNTRNMIEGWYHPIVRTHPKTNEKALYVDHAYSHGIEGMTRDEADGLLGFLKKHVAQLAFSCRLRWEPKTFAVWDNRISIHQAFNDYDGYRREMYRTIVMGEVPK